MSQTKTKYVRISHIEILFDRANKCFSPAKSLHSSNQLSGLYDSEPYYCSDIEYYDQHMRNDCLQLKLGRCVRRAVTELSKREESHCTRTH